MNKSPPAVWLTLRHRTFRAIWIAGLISMIGSWMQGLGAAWLMTGLERSPLMIGLVQTAQMLPAFLLALPAGALADMFDRRRFLTGIMAWQTAVTLTLAVLTYFDLVTPWMLLGFIFAVGAGGAAQVPVMSTIIQDIVPRDEVIGAVTLNSISMNLSRAVGPALAGLLVAASSVASAFLVNAFSYLVFMATVMRHVPSTGGWTKGGQSFASTITSGLRYARKARRFQAVLIRGFCYFIFASATITLLPSLARHELDLGAEVFGTLLGFIGLGAILNAILLIPILNARFSRDNIVLGASLIVAAALVGIGWIREYFLLAPVLIIFGAAWMTSMVSFQVAAQMVLPGWVRGRGLSMSMMAFMAGMSAGGVIWGKVAEATDVATAFSTASVGLLATAIITYRFKIGSNETEDA